MRNCTTTLFSPRQGATPYPTGKNDRATLDRTRRSLAKALLPAMPRRKSRTHRPVPVILAYERLTQTLIVAEAAHSRFLNTIRLDTAGHWPLEVIVDGVLLAWLLATYQSDAVVTLAYDDASLILKCGGSCVRFNRINGDKKRACRRRSFRTLGLTTGIRRAARCRRNILVRATIKIPRNTPKAHNRKPGPGF